MATAAQDEFDTLIANQDRHARTSHPEDASTSADTSEPSSDIETKARDSDGEDETAINHSNPMPSSIYHIPNGTTFDANTGPKGVIADAKSFDRARKRGFRQSLYAFSNGLAGTVLEKQKISLPSARREGSPSTDSSADDDEDDFMREWRAKRIIEMQSGGQDRRTRRQSPSKRRYGYVSMVDAIGYLDAVEKVASDTVVVVCIYDEESAVSAIVEDALSNLARKHETTRFVKLAYREAEMDVAVVPAILAYKGSELIANLVSLIDEIPSGRDMSASSLEWLLLQHRVLF
ncbi:MAG: hypothetical protein Q9187_000090 [Circinaria calcarea]